MRSRHGGKHPRRQKPRPCGQSAQGIGEYGAPRSRDTRQDRRRSRHTVADSSRVHPAAGNFSGTLVNALLHHCGDSLSGINGVIRPGIVHRIDKDTSGLLIVAKTDIAHRGLAEQIKEHSFTREYKTVVVGNIKANSGTIDAPIGRHPKDRKKQAVTDKNSKNAITHFEVLERFNGFTYLKVRLETGRTHQIRVHMAYRGTPVAGDVVYGNPKKTYGLEGQCLHAATIGFIHPITNEYLEFTADLPHYFKDFLRRIS